MINVIRVARLVCCCLCVHAGVWAQNKISLNIAKAGTLSEQIASSKKYQIDELIVSGTLNGSDIRFIRDMAGCDATGKETKGILRKLDMSGVNIISGGDYYYETGGIKYYTLISGTSSGNGVSYSEGVGSYMFAKTKLVSITLPISVSVMGEGVFFGCTELESFVLSPNVPYIKPMTFAQCSFKEFSVPESIKSIEKNAFAGCSSLAKLVIPENVTTIVGGAFGECPVLREIKVDEKNKKYADIDGVVCSKDLTVLRIYPNGKGSEYTVPETVNTIDDFAFQGTDVEYVTLTDNITHIGVGAFSDCTKLRAIAVPNSVLAFRESAFANCSSLESIHIPNQITVIDRYVFQGCKSLEKIQLPIKTERIRDAAFQGCLGIDSIALPSTVKYIDASAFAGCTKVEAISCMCTELPTLNKTAFEGINQQKCKLYVPVGAYSRYWIAPIWGDFASIIEQDGDGEPLVSLTVAASYNAVYGKVLINGQQKSSELIDKDTKVEFTIQPAKGYGIAQVMLNNKNVTADVNDEGLYTIAEATENMVLQVTFKELPYYLTIRHADNGLLKQLITRGEQYTFTILPAEGWNLNTVTFNDNDVPAYVKEDGTYTTQALKSDAELAVTFESTASSVEDVRADEPALKVYTQHDELILQGTVEGQKVQVYTTDGINAGIYISTGGLTRITLRQNVTYLVRVGMKTYKVAM